MGGCLRVGGVSLVFCFILFCFHQEFPSIFEIRFDLPSKNTLPNKSQLLRINGNS